MVETELKKGGKYHFLIRKGTQVAARLLSTRPEDSSKSVVRVETALTPAGRAREKAGGRSSSTKEVVNAFKHTHTG